jgi:hypothetical protein
VVRGATTGDALQLAGLAPGANALRLRVALDDGSELAFTAEAHVRDGVTAAELDLPMAGLRVTPLPADGKIARVRYRWRARSGQVPWATGEVAAELVASCGPRPFTLRVPAGSGRLVQETVGDDLTVDERLLGEVELAADALVDVPARSR